MSDVPMRNYPLFADVFPNIEGVRGVGYLMNFAVMVDQLVKDVPMGHVNRSDVWPELERLVKLLKESM